MKQFQADPERGSFEGWLFYTTRWKISEQFAKRQAAPRQEQPTSGTGRGGGARRTATADRIPDPAERALEEVWDKEWEQQVRRAVLRRIKSRLDPL